MNDAMLDLLNDTHGMCGECQEVHNVGDMTEIEGYLYCHKCTIAALRAERDELREALDIIANEDYQHIGQLKAIARAVLAKYTKGDSMNIENLKDELPSFAAMIEFLDRIKGKISGSEQYKIDNICAALIEAAKVVTVESADEETEAIENLNNIMR